MAFSGPAGGGPPPRAARAAHLRRRLRALFERYGYEPVEVPTLEYIDLYHRQRIGDGLFHGLLSARLPDGAEFPARDLAASPDPHGLPPLAEAVHEVVLRPEFTAPVARLVITELAEWVEPPALPWRLHYAGSVFRDLGVGPLRQREFTQVGVERIGGPRRPGDLEILQLACDGAEALGLPDWHLTLGHAGYLAAVLAEWRSRWAHGRRSRSASTGRFACGGRPAVRRRSGPPTCPRGCRSCGAGPRPRSARAGPS